VKVKEQSAIAANLARGTLATLGRFLADQFQSPIAANLARGTLATLGRFLADQFKA
jgi:hypothetical protein